MGRDPPVENHCLKALEHDQVRNFWNQFKYISSQFKTKLAIQSLRKLGTNLGLIVDDQSQIELIKYFKNLEQILVTAGPYS